MKQGLKTSREIVVGHFDIPFLKDFRIVMAEKKVLGHCELLNACNDMMPRDDRRFKVSGGTNFEHLIKSLEPD